MNILGRITAILAAALVIVGIALGLAKTGVIQSNMPERGGYEQRQVTSTTTTATTTQTSDSTSSSSTTSSDSQTTNADFSAGGHEREEGGNIFGIVQVFMNLIIESLIVLPFVLLPKFWNKSKSGGPQPPLDNATYA